MLNRIVLEFETFIYILTTRPRVWVIPCLFLIFCMCAYLFILNIFAQQDVNSMFYPVVDKIFNKRLHGLSIFMITSFFYLFIRLYLKERKRIY